MIKEEILMSEVSMGTLYEFNKSAMSKDKKMSSFKLTETLNKMIPFFSEHTYFMLLCHEQRDYTVFRLSSTEKEKNAIQDLKKCLINRGDILYIEKENINNAYEIWMRIEDNIYVYYLFPYDEAIIEC
jgi:hypothetical protein